MATDLEALEVWATFAAEALQEVIDDCVTSSPETPEDEVCQDLRGLLADLDRIMLGGSSLMTLLRNTPDDGDAKLVIDI